MFVFNIGDFIQLIIIIIALLLFLIVYLIYSVKEWVINKRYYRKIKKNREITIKIMNEFENILAENNMKIPDKDRKENEDEACIYGTTYYDLEDTILEILNNKNN